MSASQTHGGQRWAASLAVGSDLRWPPVESHGITRVSKVIPRWLATVNQSSLAPVGSDGQPVDLTVAATGIQWSPRYGAMAASRNHRGYDGQQCYPTVVSDGHLSSSASVGSDGLPVEATVGSDGRQSNPSPGVTTVSKVIPQWVATVNQSSPAPVGSDGQPVDPAVGTRSDGRLSDFN